LKEKYQEMFEEELVDRLRGELSGDFEEVVTAVMDVRNYFVRMIWSRICLLFPQRYLSGRVPASQSKG